MRLDIFIRTCSIIIACRCRWGLAVSLVGVLEYRLVYRHTASRLCGRMFSRASAFSHLL
jgi:hypothetical protein